MKFSHRKKEKWIHHSIDSESNEVNSSAKNKSKTERREKHKTKIKRLHQYLNLKDLFEDGE